MSSSSSRTSTWPAVTLVVAVICLLISIPDSWKPWAPGILRQPLKLGLDLAGGTQLDFRISEDEIKALRAKTVAEIAVLKDAGKIEELRVKEAELLSLDEQEKNLVEAIRTVLERRINALGVSEATITPSFFGDEKHLLVECPGIIDVKRCIETVGKTIRLEFKEEFSGDPAAYAASMRAKAEAVYRSVITGTGSLQVAGQDLSDQLGVSFVDEQTVYLSALPKGLESLKKRTSRDPVLKANVTFESVVGQGEGGVQEVRDVQSVALVSILEDRVPAARPLADPVEAMDELKKTTQGSVRVSKQSAPIDTLPLAYQSAFSTMEIGTETSLSLEGDRGAVVLLLDKSDGAQSMDASHILVQYVGATKADPSVKRTKEEARAAAENIRERILRGESFTTIAKRESDGPSKAKAGSLGTIQRGSGLSDAFDAAAFSLKTGELSAVVETPYGFHVIRADRQAFVPAPTVSYESLEIAGGTAEAEALLTRMKNGEVTRPDETMVVRSLVFSLEPTGWQDTALNGQRFRSASVVQGETGLPVVQIRFDAEGAKLFEELTARNIKKRIAIFVGGELVSAPTVENTIAGGSAVITGSRSIKEASALAQDLNTGAIPAPIHLVGQSTVEATLGTDALSKSVLAAAVGIGILCVLLMLLYRVLGVAASIALLLYVVLLVAAMKLPLLLISRERVVLTLAGIAGMILSIGMAIDANVLAFERIKEELRHGKALKTAIEAGFRKSWPSVRDGNASTLITSGILFLIGTSIIRGFAITLSLGIFLSLFTGVVVSKWICLKFAASALGQRPELFGGRKPSAHHTSLES